MTKQPVYNLSEKEFSLLSKFGWMWFLTHPISQKLCQIMITENKMYSPINSFLLFTSLFVTVCHTNNNRWYISR